jgi:asparagine synthase (glutamine-hydrolysing)
VSYNGEIYGKVALDGSPVFASPQDCSDEIHYVISEDISESRLDGMYAFASLPVNVDGIKLRRDSFGIKPLYYKKLQQGYAVASELPPLINTSPHSCEIREGAIAELLAFGKVLGNHTLYEDVYTVLPGDEVKLWDSASIIRRSPFSFLHSYESENTSIRDALYKSVEKCLLSDRQLGIALSGGIDSAIVAYILNDLGVENIFTISVLIPGVMDGVQDLRLLGLPNKGAWTTWNHKAVLFNSSDLPAMIGETVDILGQPTRMTSTPLYLSIAKAAKDLGVVVLLTGEGADELFGGYTSYLSWFKSLLVLPNFDALYEFCLPGRRRAYLDQLIGGDLLRWCSNRFQATYHNLASLDPFNSLRHLELTLSLEPLLTRIDHCLMKHTVEGRTPYLHGAVPFMAAGLKREDLIGESETKIALRMEFQDILSPNVLSAGKKPFRLPIMNWFANELSDWVNVALLSRSSTLEKLGINTCGLRTLLSSMRSGDGEASSLCFTLLTMLAWKDRYCN